MTGSTGAGSTRAMPTSTGCRWTTRSPAGSGPGSTTRRTSWRPSSPATRPARPLVLAHFRAMPRPLGRQRDRLLDDLFVDPTTRPHCRRGPPRAGGGRGGRRGWAKFPGSWLDSYRARTLSTGWRRNDVDHLRDAGSTMIVSRRATLLAALALALGPAVSRPRAWCDHDAPSAAGLPGAGGLLIDVPTPVSSARPACPGPPCASPSGRRAQLPPQLRARGPQGRRRRPRPADRAHRRRWPPRQLRRPPAGSEGVHAGVRGGGGAVRGNLGPGWVARGLPLEP